MSERGTFGVIATLVHEHGVTSVYEGQGNVTEAVTQIAAHCDRKMLKVVTLSTPITVEADFKQNTRRMANSFEQQYLGKIKRGDLIAGRA